ncbi:abortive infection system toxin AbiGii family protein [Thomasclavelia spiroformis]|uniref:abortive infection system toxin AbiGii family protein n=1 Tax=Thomasclavelia spiroformis TaxID=29348 RepID=UPI0039906C07
MYSNFKETFIKKPQYKSEPPKAVMDAINKDLPVGFKYVYANEGLCCLNAPDGFNIDSGTIHLAEEAKNVLPENPSFEQIEQYLYNSQTDLVISPDKDGFYKINGVQIKAQDLVKTPLKNYTFENIQVLMKPSPFPQPFEMVFSGNGYDKTLHMQRTPYNSLHIQRFESIEETPISVVYYVDMKEKKFTITFKLCIKNAKTVLDVLTAYKIYNAFMDGKGKIGGIKFSGLAPSSEKKVSREAIEFWEKLYKLEDVFKITFDIKNEITVRAARYVEEIYRCIVQRKPYKVYKQYNSVKGKGLPQDVREIISSNKEIYFEFNAEESYELLGQTILLKGVFGIFGACVKNPVPPVSNDEEVEIMLKNVEGKKMYESVMLFLTDDEVDDFRKNKKHLEIMSKAEEITLIE